MPGFMPRAAGRDRVGAGVSSALLHLLLVAGALHAAGESRPDEPPPTPPDTALIYLPSRPVAPVHPGGPAGPAGPGGAGGTQRPPSEHELPARPRFADSQEGLPESPLTPPDAYEPGARIADEAREAIGRRRGGGGEGGSGAGGGAELPGPAGGIHTGSSVERAVRLAPGSPAPAYPELLRRAGVEGSVVIRFIVDSSGRVEPGSSAVLSATHPAFAEAVGRVLPRLRFMPAEHGGRRVRQLVDMPFSFTLER